jgi:hypothetical protein
MMRADRDTRVLGRRCSNYGNQCGAYGRGDGGQGGGGLERVGELYRQLYCPQYVLTYPPTPLPRGFWCT